MIELILENRCRYVDLPIGQTKRMESGLDYGREERVRDVKREQRRWTGRVISAVARKAHAQIADTNARSQKSGCFPKHLLKKTVSPWGQKNQVLSRF